MVTKDEIFTNILAVTYRLSAEDWLAQLSGAVHDEGIFQEYKQRIQKINDRKSFDEFIESIPQKKNIEAQIKQKIRDDYKGIEEAVAEINVERTEALKEVQIDYFKFSTEIKHDLEKRLRVNLNIGYIRTENDFNKQQKKYASHIKDILQDKIKPREEGIFVGGDMVEIVDFAGFDVDSCGEEDVYYYDGDPEDVPLGTICEVIRLNSPDQILLNANIKGKNIDWLVHPDEIKFTGENFYNTILKGNENTEQAAEQLVEKVATALRLKFEKEAKERIDTVFDNKIYEEANFLNVKFGLSKEQIKAVEEGKDFRFELPDVDEEGIKTVPFEDIARLALRALAYKNESKKEFNYLPKEANTEEGLREIVLDTAKEFMPEHYLAVAKKQMDELANVLEKGYSDVYKHWLQRTDKTILRGYLLREAIDSWLGRRDGDALGLKFSFKRALLYNDSDIYTAEPFSAPSEELQRVLKLELGNGCRYGKCTFCTEYGDANFFMRKPDEFKEHINTVKKMIGDEIEEIERLFIAGGDIFALPKDKLLKYVDMAKNAFHGARARNYKTIKIRRIAAFTRTEGILKKSIKDMNEIERRGLNLLFWGVETGSDAVLNYVNKGITAAQMREAAEKIAQTSIRTSIMIMPGLGGLKYYEEHAVETANLLNTIKPRYITFLSVNPSPQSEYAKIMLDELQKGENMPLSSEMVVEQMYDIVRLIDRRRWDGRRCLIAAYQMPVERVASNPVQFRGRLEYGNDEEILKKLEQYFNNRRKPSKKIPNGAFNKGSILREMAMM